ncbi:hypothetical protein H5410_025950 [Solanum commersonii]|uniref:Uncharacterized protein n=1 Tax=Solanum commersonii TaxID=4109 RepID=A0A9J5YVN3_SOLCO|nr:hypothetical protein H5410_025950 [Solanum commersonii]
MENNISKLQNTLIDLDKRMEDVSNQCTTSLLTCNKRLKILGLTFFTSLFNLIHVRKSITTKLFDLQRLNIFHLNTYEHLISETIVLRELELANADVDAVNGVENLILERSVPLRVENIIELNCAHIFVPKAKRAERILFGVTVFIQVLTLFFFTLVLRCVI